MSDVKVYDADQMVISFASIDIRGWADGDFLVVENESDAFSDVAGTDGETTRSKTNDNRATITVSTMQSSDANAKLSALHNLDKATPGGAGISNLRIQDLNGNTLIEADKAWIQKAPDATWSRDPKERQWKIRCGDLQRLDGGN